MHPNSLANLRSFAPGVSGNPGGKPKGALNRLQGDFVRDLAEEWSAHGKEAIRRCAELYPAKYLAIMASLVVKWDELDRRFGRSDQPNGFNQLSDDELEAAIAFIKEAIAAAEAPDADNARGLLCPDRLSEAA
jgi:hypothetical protein